MATFKIKFRQSKVNESEGRIYYRFIYGRMMKQFKTNYTISVNEWDTEQEALIIPADDGQRSTYLVELQRRLLSELARMRSCFIFVKSQRKEFNLELFVSIFTKKRQIKTDFFSFMQDIIEKQYILGNIRMGEIYTTALNSLMCFCGAATLPFEKMNSDFISLYEVYLKRKVSHNTSSFYMRNLRSVYNRAVDKGYAVQNNPFRKVYTGVEKTMKRAVNVKVIRKMRKLSLDDKPQLAFARDIFMFSFYTRGMAFIDIAFLRKSDLFNGVLTYCRRKTGQRIMVKWEECMNEIVKRYTVSGSLYMFPIIEAGDNIGWRSYRTASARINKSLKLISGMLHLERPLTMYVARHTWATVAKSKNVPISVISDGMGHDSERTTRIYLAMFDTVAVDRANRKIIASLQ